MALPRLDAILIGGTADAWRSLGFAGGRRLRFSNGCIELDADAGPGITSFRVDVADRTPGAVDVDGVPFELVRPTGRTADCATGRIDSDHPNGAFELDHVVLTTDSLDRTSSAIDAQLGLPLKRVRDVGDVRQGFHRFADVPGARGCIIEVVESSRAPQGSASPWGLVINVHDLGAAAEHPEVGEVRQAVQPGRRIATVSREARLGAAVALMTP